MFPGTALVTFGDSGTSGGGQQPAAQHSSSRAVVGDMLCLLSGMFYASYTVAVRLLLPDDEKSPTMLFFGFVGALNGTVLLPFILIFNRVGLIHLAELSTRPLVLTVLKGEF